LAERQTPEKLKRLNLILRTIRTVDQVILEEKDRDRLIQGICESLVKTRGYYNAWIALMDKAGKFTTFAEAGLGKDFQLLTGQLVKEGATKCGLKALTQSRAVVTSDPASECDDCPLSVKYRGRGGITARLQYRGNRYGLLCASVPSSLVTEAQERSLFEDIAGDVAFALYETEMEEERERVEVALRESENRYRNLFDSANDGMIVRDLEGNIIMANGVMTQLTGYTIDELTSMNISQLLSSKSLERSMARQREHLENKPEVVPRRYRLQMIRKDGTERTIEVVTSLLSGGEQRPIIQAIARDITEQMRARDNLRAYASRAIMAQEEERKRIARELHDDTAQALASLGMDIDSLVKTKAWNSKDISKRLRSLRDRTGDILRGVRTLSQDLRPTILDELGLLVAIEGLANDLAEKHDLKVGFDVRGTPRRLSSDTELALFRIVQEALTNIGKHARASRFELDVEFGTDNITLKISDNGRGFHVPPVIDDFAYSDKLGLTGMRERAKLIDGTLSIISKPGQGTNIILEVTH